MFIQTLFGAQMAANLAETADSGVSSLENIVTVTELVEPGSGSSAPKCGK